MMNGFWLLINQSARYAHNADPHYSVKDVDKGPVAGLLNERIINGGLPAHQGVRRAVVLLEEILRGGELAAVEGI